MSGGGGRTRPRHVGRWRPNSAAPCRAVAAERGRVMSGGGGGRMRPRYVGHWRPNAAASCRAVAAAPCRVALMGHGRNLKFAQLVTEFVGLAYPAARAVTSCNLAVSDMYMRDFGKTHQIAYTYCSVGISDLKPLTGTSADQLPHRKSQSLATA